MGLPVVWVLGSGFSAGLGAPQLDQLISVLSMTSLKRRFSSEAFASLWSAPSTARMVRIYEQGKGQLWTHAEEFLDFAELALHDAVRDEALHDIDNNLPRDARNNLALVQRFVAAEVSALLLVPDLKAELAAEKWHPYLRWVRALTTDDTIITFN